MKWLNDRRVIYRHDGDDIPTIETKEFKYYENGTYACYHLFNTKAKITTYKSLKWHMLVLYYLNNHDGLPINNLPRVFKFIANKDNGFVTFFISKKALDDMISDVLNTGGDPPKNKKRKVIFKPYNMLTLSQKLSIVGKLIGRSSICKETIYQAMIDISEHRKITVRWLAEVLGVSQRTIYRHMCDDLKRAKQEMNEEI